MAIFDALVKDFAPVEYRRISLRDFYSSLAPEHREMLRNFEIRRLLSNRYLNQFIPIALEFFRQTNLSTSDLQVPTGQNVIVLNMYSKEEKAYQNHLKACVKESVNEMIAKGWAKHLSINGSLEEGKEALECFDPSAAQPLAHIAQVKELENALQCPEQFKHRDLKKYNNPSRHEALATTAAAWKALPSPDRELLLERLIKTSSFDLGERKVEDETAFNKLYLSITTLAADLHQGKLMCVMTLNVGSQDFSAENYFAKAWGEALNALD